MNPDATPSPNPRLEALASMTKETEAANPDPAAQQAEQAEQEKKSQAEQGARDWGMLMYTLGELACMVAPELRPVYAEKRCLEWGTHAHAVSVKYGWNGPSVPEIALLASTIGFALPTWVLVRQRLAQLKKSQDGTLSEKLAAWWQAKREKPAAGPDDGSKQ